MRVLVTDGNERSALAVTRALGQKKIQVVVGAETASSLAGASRYCSHAFVYPPPSADSDGFVATLLEVVKRGRFDAMFPVSDLAMQTIGPEWKQFEEYTALPIPPFRIYEDISNKYQLMKLASKLRIPIPKTVFVPYGQIDELVNDITTFPVVVKPGRSVMRKNGKWIKTGVHYADSAGELLRLYEDQGELKEPSLIQHRVEGEGQGLFVLMEQGKLLGHFAHRRLREKPPSGGVSVLRESIPLPQPMSEYALRLLQHVGWHGVAMVEFKIDRQSGVPMLMEVNGRFWGSLQLALDAGVNFPYLLYQMATGQPTKVPPHGYRIGVKSRWLLGDLDHLLLRLFKSEDELHLPPDSPSRWECLLDFCRFFQRGMHYEVERFDDPGPCAYEMHQYLKNMFRSRS
jgi:predicted ATP-grasp superfamily ATP-dependent carboligase